MSLKPANDGSVQRRPLPGWSLVTRLSLWYAITSFGLVALVTAILYWGLAHSLDVEDDQLLSGKMQEIQSLLQRPDETRGQLERLVQSSGDSLRFYVRVLDQQATLLETAGMERLLPSSVFSPPDHAGGISSASKNLFLADGAAKRAFRIGSVSVGTGADDNAAYVVQIALDRSHEAELLREYRRLVWLILAVAVIGSVAGGYWIARRGMQPISQIAAAAAKIGTSTLHERIAVEGLPAELSGLASTFNSMLSRLENSFERLIQLSDDLAHELRTPINNLRGTIEVTLATNRSPEEYREALGSSLEECTRLAQLIDNLLFLARADQPATSIQRGPVDVAAELERLREYFEAAAEESGVALVVHGRPGWIAYVDRTLLQRAVSNLVSNAIRHTPAGGKVEVQAEIVADELVIHVADTGEGIPSAVLPHIFDRFFRADHSRSVNTGGAGLGLAIVKGIAQLHGGSVSVVSEPERGTRFCLRLGLQSAY